jgi:hypothetical protein
MPSAVPTTPASHPPPASIVQSRVVVAALILTVAWLAAYAPTIAGGFIKDDFGWIYHSRLSSWSALYAMFAGAQVFYRPMVQLSFGLTELLFGTNPVPYALTNLALGIACALSIYQLARVIGLQPWAAIVATAVWAFNFHGINMAIVWLSGRTSLLGTLFSVLAASAMLRNHGLAAGVLALAAFLSKEEVVALPLILTIWAVVSRSSLRAAIGPWVALGVYFGLRQISGAVGVADAPPYYQFTFDPAHVGNNIVEYADRSMTLGVLLMIATVVALRRLPAPTSSEWRVVLMGAVWLIGGFAATIWLPVRSSLYAVFPSVGVALAAGVLVTATVRNADPRHAWRAAIAGLLLPFLLLPVYWQRNVRWTELRTLSTATIRAIQADALPRQTLVVLEDDLTHRANFRHVFGPLLHEAAALHFGNRLALWIEPPPPEIDASTKPLHSTHVVTFRLVGGRIEPARTINAATR